jgi:uncharacterized protein (TIGR00106 family)
MSVLIEFSMFPTDKGESVSEYVSRVVEMIDRSGYTYKLTAMGTIIETPSLSEALQIVQKSYEILEPNSRRVFASVKLDIRKESENRLEEKIRSVEKIIGKLRF